MKLFQQALKRILDLVLSILLIALFCPLFMIIILSIWLDSGRPVFFVQERIGKDFRVFPCLKFRTLLTGTPMQFNADGSTRVLEKDPCMTRVGRFLRKYSLDELPQLLNVFMGQMSLVGPRPDIPINLANYDDQQMRRFSVKPGLTGLAQVSGRNSLSFHEKVCYDLKYIRDFSLLLDLKIFICTIRVLARGTDVFN